MAEILVVDDISDNIKLLTFDLEDEGHIVRSASSGEDALISVDQQMPDLILLDIMMPGMSGIEVCQQLKQNDRFQDIPIILVSAKDLDDDIAKGLDIGAHDYVTKPYNYTVLSARMRSALRLKETQDKLTRANVHLRKLATTDPLTELYNRRHFFELSSKELARCHRFNKPMGILMIDIDHFKLVNDNWGHVTGDKLLQQLAITMQACFRELDILARIGGEEFAACLPETEIEGAMHAAERMKNAIESLVLEEDRGPLSVTASIGVAQRDETVLDLSYLLKQADEALYQAKAAGRNRVICAQTHLAN